MSSSPPEVDVAGWLLHLPLASAREIARFHEVSSSVAYRALAVLERAGLAACVTAGIPLVPPCRRYWITPAGIKLVATANAINPDRLLAYHPISREWLHSLLRRLDSVIPIYQVASAVTDLYHVSEFRWYRTYPLDAGLLIKGGGSVAFHREGPLATLFHRRRRLYALAEARVRPITLVLVADEVRQRDWVRRMLSADLPGAIAVQDRFLADPSPDAELWLLADRTTSSRVSLRSAFDHLIGSRVPGEIEFRQVSLPPESVAVKTSTNGRPRDYELPVLLKPLEKRVLDLVGAWPLLTVQDLAAFMGITRQGVEKALRTPASVGLVDTAIAGDRRARRLVLSNRGLLMLAKRDRLPTQHTLYEWSAATRNGATWSNVGDIRGTRMRALTRAVAHTAAVCRFFAMFHTQARQQGGRLINVESYHRSWRGFADQRGYAGQLRPDGYGVYEQGAARVAFFLEWERRADRPGRYRHKLWPYIRYYKSDRAWADARQWPLVLMVLRDATAEDGFWEVASDWLQVFDLTGRLTILTTTEDRLLITGPLGRAWALDPGGRPWKLLEAAGVDA